MLNLTPIRTQEAVEERVRQIIADQMAISAFEVKLTDEIDVDLGVAGDDVDEIFAEIRREFGTDFTELSAYAELYFTPEVAPMDFGFFPYLLICLVAILAGLFHHLWPSSFWPTTLCLALVAFSIRKLVRTYLAANYEPKLLSFTVGDLVDAVVAGKWIPPEGMWQRIERLGQKKLRS